MDIFVSNLPPHIDGAALGELFSPYGTVVSAKVIMDSITHNSKCYGFVTMDDSAAQTAIQELNGSDLAGKPVSVVLSQPKPATLFTNLRQGTAGGSRRGY